MGGEEEGMSSAGHEQRAGLSELKPHHQLYSCQQAHQLYAQAASGPQQNKTHEEGVLEAKVALHKRTDRHLGGHLHRQEGAERTRHGPVVRKAQQPLVRAR